MRRSAAVVRARASRRPLAASASAQVITEFPITTAGADPRGITAGPDGNLWFTEFCVGKIGRITTAGVVTEFPAAGFPQFITVGSDGNLWFPETDVDKIGRMTTAGGFTDFPIATTSGARRDRDRAGRQRLVRRSERRKDRPDHARGHRDRIPDPDRRRHPVADRRRPGRQPLVHEFLAGKIGRITTAGVVTEFPVPSAGSRRRESRPARTATSGSPTPAPTRSDGSRRPAPSPSSRSRPPTPT